MSKIQYQFKDGHLSRIISDELTVIFNNGKPDFAITKYGEWIGPDESGEEGK
jgi:hypothetical protein